MSMNKIIIIFGIILVIFAAIVSYQFSSKKNIPATTDLGKATVSINDHTFQVEIATTSASQQLGLSGRKSLGQDRGLLFLFDKPDYYSFWMKDMLFPIDIIYIDNEKVVSIIHEAQPPKTANPEIFQPDAPSDSVLEINAGLAKKYTIKKGDTVTVKH